MMDDLEARSRARYEAEKDPVQREAYALAKRAGFDWYNTESAARRMAEHAAGELVPLQSVARNVADIKDEWISKATSEQLLTTLLELRHDAKMTLFTLQNAGVPR